MQQNNIYYGAITFAIGLLVIGLSWLGIIPHDIAFQITALLGLGIGANAHAQVAGMKAQAAAKKSH